MSYGHGLIPHGNVFGSHPPSTVLCRAFPQSSSFPMSRISIPSPPSPQPAGQYTEELWQACAGPLVSVPEVGHYVWYFPQGHMEQVAASTNPTTNQKLPMYYKLPSQILCRVMQVSLTAEPETDEVFAQLNLLPDPDHNFEPPPEKEESVTVQPKRQVRIFTKILTASDTSTHGGFSVLRKHAEECLPLLDMSLEIPSQELVATDLHGHEWKFRHTYRGHPRRHLLTTGWSYFVSQKRLVAGDAVIFLRGENDELRVGIRRAKRPYSSQSSNVLTSDSMHMAVVATASYANSTKTMFAVYYRPRSSPSSFLVPVEKLAKCLLKELSVGMRFKIKYETEDASDRSFAGTITGVEDLDPSFPNSKWRSLRVNWDEMTMIERQDRVSPWEIELCASSSPVNPSSGLKSKRIRPLDSAMGNPPKAALVETMKSPGILQGQGIGGMASEELLKRHFWKRGEYDDSLALAAHDRLKTNIIVSPTEGWSSHEDGRKEIYPRVSSVVPQCGAGSDSHLLDAQESFKKMMSTADTYFAYQDGTRQDFYLGLQSATSGGNCLQPRMDGSHHHHRQPHIFQQEFHTSTHKRTTGLYSNIDNPKVGADLQLCVAVSNINGNSINQASQWGSLPSSCNSVAPCWGPCSDASQNLVGCTQYLSQDKELEKPATERGCKIFGVSLNQPTSPTAPKDCSGGDGTEDDTVQLKAPFLQQAVAMNSYETNSQVAVLDPMTIKPDPTVKTEVSSEVERSDNSVQKTLESRSRPPRSCTKVIKKGSMVGRGVDLSKFNCYEKLIEELEGMFHIEGQLSNPARGWQVAYSDNEGDMMQVGDDPWIEFCNMAHKIYIFSPDEVQAGALPSAAKAQYFNSTKGEHADSFMEAPPSAVQHDSVPVLPG